MGFWSAPPPPVAPNFAAEPPAAIATTLAICAMPICLFYMLGPRHAEPQRGPSFVPWLLRFASQPWFPLVAGAATAMNMFTIVFTAATVVLFMAAVLGRPRKFVLAAVVNAAGATLGTAILLLLVRDRGLSYIDESFPNMLASPAWLKAMGLMDTYGAAGMLLVSTMPILLHPVIAFGMVAGLSNTTILLIVMAGRTVKYVTMGYLASTAPAALRFFGIKTEVLEYATQQVGATRLHGKAE